MDASVDPAERNRRPRRVRETDVVWSEGEFRPGEMWRRRKGYGANTMVRPPEIEVRPLILRQAQDER